MVKYSSRESRKTPIADRVYLIDAYGASQTQHGCPIPLFMDIKQNPESEELA